MQVVGPRVLIACPTLQLGLSLKSEGSPVNLLLVFLKGHVTFFPVKTINHCINWHMKYWIIRLEEINLVGGIVNKALKQSIFISVERPKRTTTVKN